MMRPICGCGICIVNVCNNVRACKSAQMWKIVRPCKNVPPRQDRAAVQERASVQRSLHARSRMRVLRLASHRLVSRLRG